MRLFRFGNRNKTLSANRAPPVSPAQNGVGVPYHGAYSWHKLPGSGANQWSWDRLALPTYSPGGLGCPNGLADPGQPDEIIVNAGQIVHSPSMEPVGNVIQGAILYMLGDPGTPAGYFVLQPLTNTSPAGLYAPDMSSGESSMGSFD